jgi:hypothetical protein
MSMHSVRVGLLVTALTAAGLSLVLTGTIALSQPPPTSRSRPRQTLSQEERALLAIQEQGRQRVDLLVRELRLTPSGPEWWRLQRRIAEAKREGERELLLARLEFATRRGDADAAAETRRALDLLDHPHPNVPPAGSPGVVNKPIVPAAEVRHDR